MSNNNIIIAGIVLSLGLLSSCGTRTDRSIMEGENTRSTTNRVTTTTSPNRVNNTTTRTTNTSTDRVNNTTASNRQNQNTSVTDPANVPSKNRLLETTTSKQHMDDNATLNRRNENTQTVDRMENRDDVHNTNQDDKVQQTVAANSRKILYTQLNMSQEQIQKLDSKMHNQNNSRTQSAQTESPRDRQLRIDGYFKEILDGDQFTRYESWKNENPNTKF